MFSLRLKLEKRANGVERQILARHGEETLSLNVFKQTLSDCQVSCIGACCHLATGHSLSSLSSV